MQALHDIFEAITSGMERGLVLLAAIKAMKQSDDNVKTLQQILEDNRKRTATEAVAKTVSRRGWKADDEAQRKAEVATSFMMGVISEGAEVNLLAPGQPLDVNTVNQDLRKLSVNLKELPPMNPQKLIPSMVTTEGGDTPTTEPHVQVPLYSLLKDEEDDDNDPEPKAS